MVYGRPKQTTDETIAQMTKLIQEMPVTLRALVGGTTVSIREFMNMDKGLVLRLDGKPDQPLALLVGDASKFLGRPGLAGQKKAVKIVGMSAGKGEKRDNK